MDGEMGSCICCSPAATVDEVPDALEERVKLLEALVADLQTAFYKKT